MSSKIKDEQRKRLDINLTFLIQLKEVCLQIMTEEIDNPALKHILKKEFKGWFWQAKKVDREFRKYINMDKRYDDPEGMFDDESENMYNIIKSTYGLNSADKWTRAIACVKNIANEK